MAEKKHQYDSIIDAMLDEREPDWKGLNLEDAHKSGEEVADRTHQYVDEDFMDDIAESASKHTPIWGPKNGAEVYENRIAEKESASPRIHSVTAHRYMDDYKAEHGDNASLMDEVTESIESAYKGSNLAENSAEKKSITEAQVQKYVRDLLNQGNSPAKIAVKLQKLAEIELFNHQSATDYLQRNAGLIGLAYLEPNSFMDKNSPTYERTASTEKIAVLLGSKCVKCGHKVENKSVTNESLKGKKCSKCGEGTLKKWYSGFHNDASHKRASNLKCYDNGGQTIDRYTIVFMDDPQGKGLYGAIGASNDVTSPQGFFQHTDAMPGEHLGKEIKFEQLPQTLQQRVKAEISEYGIKASKVAGAPYGPKNPPPIDAENPPPDWEDCGSCGGYHPSDFAGDCRDDYNRWPSGFTTGEKPIDPNAVVAPRPMFGSSNDCVSQKRAFDAKGIKVQAASVKQVKACEGCSFFKKDASGKRCNLYHLPLVANTQELTQIVNNLTPGVPSKQKHAALVAIANGDGKRAKTATDVLSQTNIIKTADAKVGNQSKRASYNFTDVRETNVKFSSDHVAKMHEKGVPLERIAGWAEEKGFPETDVSFAFRGFVQNLRKNAKGKIVLASGDRSFLSHIGIRNEAFEGAQKCASCPAHFASQHRPIEEDRGAQRVGGSFHYSSSRIANSNQPVAQEVVVTSAKVRTLHQAGHSVQKIYTGVARKVGSVEARKAIAGFIVDMKKNPGKIGVSSEDRAFLEGKLGFKPEQVRFLNPDRRPVTQVVANVPQGQNILGYPGMEKQAGEKRATDGHAILAEYDLTGAKEMQDIDTSGPKRDDIQMNDTFKVEL